MAGYWIGEDKITDAEKVEGYIRQVMPMIEKFGGRYLTRPGSHKTYEKAHWQPDRVVIVVFPLAASFGAGPGAVGRTRSASCRTIAASLDFTVASRIWIV
ncbi:MAG: DUF1330 domain-containing protein [Rhodomicrobium sp.]